MDPHSWYGDKVTVRSHCGGNTRFLCLISLPPPTHPPPPGPSTLPLSVVNDDDAAVVINLFYLDGRRRHGNDCDGRDVVRVAQLRSPSTLSDSEAPLPLASSASVYFRRNLPIWA